jgi:hypothetical protein
MGPSSQQPGSRLNAQQIRSLVIILVLGLFVMLLGGLLAPREADIDTLPEDPTSTDYFTQARILNGGKLIELLEGLDRFEQFAEDLRVFAVDQYPEYQTEDTFVVGFNVNELKISKNENIVKAEGEFGSVDNKIQIELTVLPNERVQTSLFDTKTGVQINDRLPSNTALNGFIATLPLSTSDYVMEWNKNQNLIDITLFARSDKAGEKALNKVSSYLDEDQSPNEYVQISFPFVNSDGADGEDFRNVGF